MVTEYPGVVHVHIPVFPCCSLLLRQEPLISPSAQAGVEEWGGVLSCVIGWCALAGHGTPHLLTLSLTLMQVRLRPKCSLDLVIFSSLEVEELLTSWVQSLCGSIRWDWRLYFTLPRPEVFLRVLF